MDKIAVSKKVPFDATDLDFSVKKILKILQNQKIKI